MIAIDTNVLLRHLLDDDKAQSKKAHELIRSGEKVLVTDVVLTETIWTLKGKKYRASKDDIVTVINSLLSEPYIGFENPQVVWTALNDYRKTKSVKVSGKTKGADYPDALIVNKARYKAIQEGDVLDSVYTFDRAALEVKGTKAL